MLRVQVTYRVGDHEIERIIEVDKLHELSAEERAKLFDLATGALSITEEENENMDGERIVTLDSKESIIIKECDQEFKNDSTVGNLAVNVNVVSNIQEFTKKFEKALGDLHAMVSRPLSDFIAVDFEVNNAEES